MITLGLGGSIHDYSACLAIDGKITCAIEEERLVHAKHSLDIGMKAARSKAVQYCLETEQFRLDDVDLIIGNDIIEPVYYAKFHNRITLINHHLAHAASAFYPSPFEDAAVFIADGRGSYVGGANVRETISYYSAESKHIIEIKKIVGTERSPRSDISNSMGAFFQNVTNELGFSFMQDENIMNMAEQGNNLFVSEFYRFYNMDNEGNYSQTLNQLTALRRFIQHNLRQANNMEDNILTKSHLAYAVQYHIVRVLTLALNYLYKTTRKKNLCLAGGVLLNHVALLKLRENIPFEHVFVQPAAGDSGTSLGSALYGYFILKNQQRLHPSQTFSPFLGKEYSGLEYQTALDAFRDHIEIEKPSNLYKRAVEILASDNPVAWFQGKSEIGPRSLGNRCVLSPANHSILHHSMLTYPAENTEVDFSKAPHMPQLSSSEKVALGISPSFNQPLHTLLKMYEVESGISCLLMGSLAGDNLPMVESPEDALKTFISLDLKYLIMDQHLVHKKD